MPDFYLPNAEIWVLESDGALIDFIAMIKTEISGLFLDSTQHGKGMGRYLSFIERSLFVMSACKHMGLSLIWGWRAWYKDGEKFRRTKILGAVWVRDSSRGHHCRQKPRPCNEIGNSSARNGQCSGMCRMCMDHG